MLTWDHPPVWAVKQPTSLFLLLKDLGPDLCPQQLCSSPQSHSTRRLASGGKPAVVGILLPPAHRHLPQEGAQATSLRAARSGQKSRLRAARSLPNCPTASRAE